MIKNNWKKKYQKLKHGVREAKEYRMAKVRTKCAEAQLSIAKIQIKIVIYTSIIATLSTVISAVAIFGGKLGWF